MSAAPRSSDLSAPADAALSQADVASLAEMHAEVSSQLSEALGSIREIVMGDAPIGDKLNGVVVQVGKVGEGLSALADRVPVRAVGSLLHKVGKRVSQAATDVEQGVSGAEEVLFGIVGVLDKVADVLAKAAALIPEFAPQFAAVLAVVKVVTSLLTSLFGGRKAKQEQSRDMMSEAEFQNTVKQLRQRAAIDSDAGSSRLQQSSGADRSQTVGRHNEHAAEVRPDRANEN